MADAIVSAERESQLNEHHLPLAQKQQSHHQPPSSHKKQAINQDKCVLDQMRFLRPLLALAVIASSAPLADSVKVGDKVRKCRRLIFASLMSDI